jgi:hypothetical protein
MRSGVTAAMASFSTTEPCLRGAASSPRTIAKRKAFRDHKLAPRDRLPFIAIKTVQGDIVPWLASQTDVLANDWQITGEQ